MVECLSKAFVIALQQASEEQERLHTRDLATIIELGTDDRQPPTISVLIAVVVELFVKTLFWPVRNFIWFAAVLMVVVVRIGTKCNHFIDNFMCKLLLVVALIRTVVRSNYNGQIARQHC